MTIGYENDYVRRTINGDPRYYNVTLLYFYGNGDRDIHFLEILKFGYNKIDEDNLISDLILEHPVETNLIYKIEELKTELVTRLLRIV